MLPRQYRLKNRKAFDATYKQKQVVSDCFLTVYIGRKKTDNDIPTKIGFVVSKKLHKRATKRNRIKRLIREACRLELKNNALKNAGKYLSIIFLPKQSSLGCSFRDIQKSVRVLFDRIR